MVAQSTNDTNFTDYHRFTWQTVLPQQKPLSFITPRLLLFIPPTLIASLALILLTHYYPYLVVREFSQIILVGLLWLTVITFNIVWYLIYHSRGPQIATGTINRQGICYNNRHYLTDKFPHPTQKHLEPYPSPHTGLWKLDLSQSHFTLSFNSQADAIKALKAISYYTTHQ